MRIFYASDTTPNAFVTSNLWRNNLLLPLRDLGHDVVEFDYDLRVTFQHLDTRNPQHQIFINDHRPKLSHALLEQIRRAHHDKPIDLFFSYFTDACIETQTIDAIRSLGITTMNWFCNGSYQLYLVHEISSHYDWCLVPEKFRLEDYRRMNAHPIYCQEAANPKIYRPYNLPKTYDAVFIGQAYADRPKYIEFLLKNGTDIHVFGLGWERFVRQPLRPTTFHDYAKLGWRSGLRLWRKTHGNGVELPKHVVGGILTDEEVIRMYSRTKINIGFSTCGETHREKKRIVQIRLRDFEIPMSGGFYIVEYMEELEEFYKIGKEIECYHTPGELEEKIQFYLTHEKEREKIRIAGHRRAVRDHSWQNRFQSVFKIAGIPL